MQSATRILREPRSATVIHQFAFLFVLFQSLIRVLLAYVTQLLESSTHLAAGMDGVVLAIERSIAAELQRALA